MSTERQILVDELIRDEGVRLFPYLDSVGVETIGCGHNLTAHGISERAAMFILDEDIEAAVRDLAGSFPWFVTLDPVRQRVVTNMRFNLGGTGFRTFKHLLGALAAGEYVQAAAYMAASRWHRQVGDRAVRLEDMMRTGATA